MKTTRIAAAALTAIAVLSVTACGSAPNVAACYRGMVSQLRATGSIGLATGHLPAACKGIPGRDLATLATDAITRRTERQAINDYHQLTGG
jgi:hypothetical protein